MRVHTTSRHTRLTPTLKRYLEDRLSKLERFATVREAIVVFESQKTRQSAEVRLKTRGKDLVCREESHDLTASIDRAVDRLERQLKKLKERRSTRLLRDGTRPNGDETKGAVRSAARIAIGSGTGRGAPGRPGRAASRAAAVRSARGAAAEPAPEPVLARLVAETAPARALSPEQAKAELLSTDDAFLAFVNADSGELNVLYRRPDGHVGWLARAGRRRPRG